MDPHRRLIAVHPCTGKGFDPPVLHAKGLVASRVLPVHARSEDIFADIR